MQHRDQRVSREAGLSGRLRSTQTLTQSRRRAAWNPSEPRLVHRQLVRAYVLGQRAERAERDIGGGCKHGWSVCSERLGGERTVYPGRRVPRDEKGAV